MQINKINVLKDKTNKIIKLNKVIYLKLINIIIKVKKFKIKNTMLIK